jgi:hypothetical protein
MSNLHIFPSQFVYWEKIKNHEEIKNFLLPKIKEHSHSLFTLMSEDKIKSCEQQKCKTSYFVNDHFLEKIFKEYDYENDIIWNPIDNMLNRKDLNISRYPSESNIRNLWYNIYSPGGNHKVHTHGNDSGFSGIYILDLNEKNTTIFENFGGNTYLDHRFDTKHIEEGCVVIFPRNLLHYVNPSLKNRVTISFNILSTFNN